MLRDLSSEAFEEITFQDGVKEREDINRDFKTSKHAETAVLYCSKNCIKLDKWIKTVEELNFAHINRKDWSLLQKLFVDRNHNKLSSLQTYPKEISERMFALSKHYLNISQQQSLELEVLRAYTMSMDE